MSQVQQRQQAVVQEFAAFSSWEDRYRHLIQRGKSLGDLPDAMKDEKFKVRGCQSQVWLHAKLNDKGEVEFQADSDALIVKGLVSVLVSVYSKAKPEEILSGSPEFLKQLGFDTHLSPSRASGLYAMLKQIFYYATAFQAMLKARS